MTEHQTDNMYINLCLSIAQNSYCERLKVGAIIEKQGNIISFGFNGTIKGHENVCEFEDENGNLQTKPEVLHAESNAISKACKSTISTENSTLYCTHSPCLECSKLIIQSGIRRIVYLNEYRNTESLVLLKKAGILVQKFN